MLAFLIQGFPLLRYNKKKAFVLILRISVIFVFKSPDIFFLP